MKADWSRIPGVVEQALRLTDGAPPPVRAQIDQVDASLRDRLATGYGLDIDDPDVVYAGIVWHGLIYAQLELAQRAQMLGPNALLIIGGIFRANVSQLAEHAPAEAVQ